MASGDESQKGGETVPGPEQEALRRRAYSSPLARYDDPMKPWMTHSVGRGPSSCRQCCARTMLLDPHALHCPRMAGLIAVKLLGNAMLSTVPECRCHTRVSVKISR